MLGVSSHALYYAEVPEAFARSFSSIFRLAARIISSLFLCKFDWRSLRSALQAFLGFSSVGSGVWLSFEVRLYRVIRSGCDGLAAAATGLVGTTGVGAAGSWNDVGAYCDTLVFDACLPLSRQTHAVQRPPAQHPLRCSSCVPSVPLQVPRNVPPI